MEKYPGSDQACQNLLFNRQQLGRKLGIEESAHTPPANHYPHIYLWDSCFAAIINSRNGGPQWVRASQTELIALVEGQRSDGFIANIQFAKKGRRFDPERKLAFESSAEGSNYTQPPVLALAVAETYKAMLQQSPVNHNLNPAEEASSFLDGIYPSLRNFYNYFEKNRNNSDADKLIGVIHPHETGRDSDPTFDAIKPLRLSRQGIETSNFVDKANIAIDYFHIIAHGIKLRSAGGDIEKSREIFWVNDVMMNCIYADNLRQMSELAQASHHVEDAMHFSKLAGEVEAQILDDMWFSEARAGQGIFAALDRNKDRIQETSISNLFPLVLDGLREDQLESLLELMDSSFNTPFPLPSVASDSSNYDPHNHEADRLWRGPTWINTNWYIAERGLKKQIKRSDLSHRPDLIARCIEWDGKISKSSKNLLVMNGPCEHYDPITGRGQRRRVKNFAWSNLAYVM
jgi:hypothetical protein